MKITLALVALLFTNLSFGSHFFNCELEATVKKVKHLDRLDGSAARRGFEGGPVELIRDHEQTVTIEVGKIKSFSGHGCGLQVGQQIDLAVKLDQIDHYKKDDVLALSYRNVGDSLGSSVTWTVK